jgi:hypothetical protein
MAKGRMINHPCRHCSQRRHNGRRLPGCTTPCDAWFRWNERNVSRPVAVGVVAREYAKKVSLTNGR